VSPFGCQTLFQNIVLSVSFSIWETRRNHRGLSQGGLGNDNHVVVSHRLWFSGMCGQARCRDEGASYGCAKVLVFLVALFISSTSKCHSKSRVDRCVRRNKFTVYSRPSRRKKKNNEHAVC
jgi:hypothetical protein